MVGASPTDGATTVEPKPGVGRAREIFTVASREGAGLGRWWIVGAFVAKDAGSVIASRVLLNHAPGRELLTGYAHCVFHGENPASW